MLSTACKHAIRAILFLGLQQGLGRNLNAREIADALNIPKPFLSQLLRSLSANGLVSSVKGPGGGFYLDADNLKKTPWDIVMVIDGPMKFEFCFLGIDKCNDDNPCPIHHTFGPFKKKLQKEFQEKSIEKFVAEIKRRGTAISLNNFNPIIH